MRFGASMLGAREKPPIWPRRLQGSLYLNKMPLAKVNRSASGADVDTSQPTGAPARLIANQALHCLRFFTDQCQGAALVPAADSVVWRFQTPGSALWSPWAR